MIVGSLKFRVISLLTVCIAIPIFLLLIYYTLDINKKAALQSTKSNLEYVLKNTKNRLNFWIDTKRVLLSQIAKEPKLAKLTESLLKIGQNKTTIIQSDELSKIRVFFEKRKEIFGDLGFFIIDKDFMSLASKRDTNIGTKNLIAVHRLELLNKVFNGESVFIPPIPSDVDVKSNKIIKLNERKQYTMFFAAPIKDKKDNVIAVLTQRLEVEGKFSEILQMGRSKQSGESYVFGKNAQMLSNSRFTKKLIEIGLLKKGEKSYEKLEIRDPGGNMIEGFRPKVKLKELPLTKMAKSAISLNTKLNDSYSEIISNVEGYRDYRGVSVFGAWIWNKKFDFGMATEIDVDEALESFYVLRKNLIIITILSILFTIISTVILIILAEKANKEVESQRDEIEKQNKMIMIQAKVVAVGEMLVNIAHQWRQPLSVIAGNMASLRISIDLDKKLSNEEILKRAEQVNNQCQYLSSTIDDFRNFFQQGSNEAIEFDLKESIEKTIDLVKDAYKNNFIQIVLDLETCSIVNNKNNFIQSLINLFNNSKDAMVLNKVPSNDRYVFITMKEINQKIILSFKDSAGGLQEDVMDKIFEPYFTTKHKSQGTGLGLYMTHQIITQHLKGTISVENCEYEYDNKKFKGAKFVITIPIGK